MSDTDWMPGVAHDPGMNAGYAQGRCQMVNVKLHFTVGRYPGDYSIGKRGYFQFYVPRENEPVQFAEANAICWDSGSWNGDGPGIEFERLNYDEELTPKQIINGGAIIRWLADTYGIPLLHYDGPRVSAFSGFINHGSLLGRGEKQDHTDGVLRAEWDAMTGDDMEPDERAALLEIQGILTGGGVYPAMEARIESEVRKIVAEELAKLPGGTGSAAGGPLTITLTGSAKPG